MRNLKSKKVEKTRENMKRINSKTKQKSERLGNRIRMQKMNSFEIIERKYV